MAKFQRKTFAAAAPAIAFNRLSPVGAVRYSAKGERGAVWFRILRHLRDRTTPSAPRKRNASTFLHLLVAGVGCWAHGPGEQRHGCVVTARVITDGHRPHEATNSCISNESLHLFPWSHRPPAERASSTDSSAPRWGCWTRTLAGGA